ncbi:hypothetical protein [Pseudomarimonas salicorniae]|uniref:Glycosyl hydrolase-like 10 domain-containing protein n=1 Tax=Pseudomarimonas salicorniae TaxID=2933270 RepID=A0ABT0GJT2_9GAMM|nr:hypothetical protein [Lysobacter sp. CAU 1642]MCK7594783.1 hypothetical protein [Lysobacter sp. CAU 1642]
MTHRPRRGAGPLAASGLAAIALCVAGLAGATGPAERVFKNAFDPPRAMARGGSTHNWYALGPGCEREPFGIIANYHLPGVRTRVLKQLAGLRAAGQDRISVSLYHQRSPIASPDGRVTGTVLDSTGGRLHPQMEQNLLDYLLDLRFAAFSEVIFRYHPQGANDVRNEDGWNDSLRDENWSLIRSIEPLLTGAGLRHRTDLFAEGMPRARNVGSVIVDDVPHFEDWSDYARFVWRAYVAEFGTANTLGFSFVSDSDRTRIDARAKHMDYIYGSQRPPVLGFSLYGETGGRDEGWIFREYQRQLEDEGWGALDWIITESWYNDPRAAKLIQAAIGETGQPVRFLIQWPVTRDSECSRDVTEALPLRFEAFSDRGF